MDAGSWLAANWFSIAQTAGIVAAFAATFLQLRAMLRASRLQTAQAILATHRELWQLVYSNPSLAHIVEVTKTDGPIGITLDEQQFISQMVNHLQFMWRAQNERMFVWTQGDYLDVKDFLSLPIPRQQWQEIRKYHPDDFVTFLDGVIAGSGPIGPRPQRDRLPKVKLRARLRLQTAREASQPQREQPRQTG